MINAILIQLTLLQVPCKECGRMTRILASIKSPTGEILACSALCPRHVGEVVADIEKAASKEQPK